MITKKIHLSLEAHELFWCLRNEKNSVFLDSAMDPIKLGRYSILAWDPFLTFESKKNYIRIQDDKMKFEFIGKPFDELERLYNQYKIENSSEIPFIGGFIGFLGYDLCHEIEEIKINTIDDIKFPDCFIGLYDGGVVYDHLLKEIWIADAQVRKGGQNRLDKMESLITGFVKPEINLPSREKAPEFTSNFEREAYLKALTRVKDYIRSGDIYQANLTQRFTTTLEQQPIELYYKLRMVNPAPFAAFMTLPQGAIVSSSPERLVKMNNRCLEARPIKGTRPRGTTAEEDERLKAELIASEKDRSELLMIVDLERNDLSKVAKTGTVKVPELMVCETYPTVFHLVSTVTAELKEGLNPIDVIRATFPGGSITGAPKIRAMEVIDELEPTQRSVYTGSIGYIGFNGQMDLNIAIRTIICHHDQACFQVGGGIVWDSEEVDEYEETLHKAKAMMKALSL